MQLLKDFLRLAESFAGKLEKSRFLLLFGFTVLYSACTYISARRKFLWNDELYTYYIARLPTMSDVWGALMSGGEQLPPFFYVVTRASLSLFSINNVALRLPEMIGFWVMCICLFIFVARRASNFYGLLAAIFPLLTNAFSYAYEARPYGLVLGFASLALLSWQSATINYLRPLSIVCLAMSLAAALSSHYYGIFVIFPLALGEFVRTWTRRRLDVSVWAAFGLALTPLFWHLPLIEQARTYSSTFWARPEWMQIPDFYSSMLWATAVPVVALFFLTVIDNTFYRDKNNDSPNPAVAAPPIYEIAAAFGFLLIPIICVSLAKFVTGAYTERYALSAIIGFGVLLPFAAAKSFHKTALMPALSVVCFVGWFGVLESKTIAQVSNNPYQNVEQVFQSESEKNLPIVAAEAHTFIELVHYSPPEINARVVYLADPELSLKRLKHNSVERGMVDLLEPWFKLNIVDYKAFIASHPRFLVYGNLGFLDWIIPELQEDGRRIELRSNKDGKFLFLVYSPEQAPDSPLQNSSEFSRLR